MADTEASSGSKERVAFDIMVRIAAIENSGKTVPNPREYFLKLYRECWLVAYGNPPGAI